MPRRSPSARRFVFGVESRGTALTHSLLLASLNRVNTHHISHSHFIFVFCESRAEQLSRLLARGFSRRRRRRVSCPARLCVISFLFPRRKSQYRCALPLHHLVFLDPPVAWRFPSPRVTGACRPIFVFCFNKSTQIQREEAVLLHFLLRTSSQTVALFIYFQLQSMYARLLEAFFRRWYS